MSEIKEVYVSVETAKLLKDKGFDWPTSGSYHEDFSYLLVNNFPFNHNGSVNSTSAPTQQMAMRWLREVKNIAIGISVEFDWIKDPMDKTFTGDVSKFAGWFYEIHTIEPHRQVTESDVYDTYEDAVEAAIKYTLENLI